MVFVREVVSLEGDNLVVLNMVFVREVVSLEGDNLVVFYYGLCKRGGLS
jgi:hypothetical protein